MRWLRRLTAVAAVLAVILLGSVTIKASGITLWEAVVTWAQETFHFGSGEQGAPNENNIREYDSLAEALAVVEHTHNIVPMWVPDEYSLIEIQIVESPLQRKYVALYTNGKTSIRILVQSYLDSFPEKIEHSNSYFELLVIDGINYYFFDDNSQTQVAWINGSYECYISGELTAEQLTQMINSIKEG